MVSFWKEDVVAKKLASIAGLKKQLAQRQKELATLQARRKKLQDRLGKVDGQIADLEGSQLVKKRPRAAAKVRLVRPQKAVEKKTLRQAVAEVLGGARKALGPKEIAEALPGVGHVSKSKSLSVMVGQVLFGGPEFRRVARGKYKVDRRRLRGKAVRKVGKAGAAAGKKSKS